MSSAVQPRTSTAEAGYFAPGENFFERVLLTVVDGSLFGVLLVAPWFMGGRHPLGQLVLVLLAVTMAVAWAARQALTSSRVFWRGSPAQLLLLAAIGLVMLQITPLSMGTLTSLSPALAEKLPLWISTGGQSPLLGAWQTTSLTPHETRAGLVMLLTYALIFVITLQRVRRLEDVERLLLWLASSAVLMAIVGFAQYFWSNDKFLWLYDHPFRGTDDAVKGPFQNKNHYAHLLALGLGPLMLSLMRAMKYGRPERRATFGAAGSTEQGAGLRIAARFIGLGVVLFAALMTLSRGGAMATVVALLTSVVLLWRGKLLSGPLLAGIAGVCLFIGMALGIHGYDQVTDRLSDFSSGSIDQLDEGAVRRKLWAADLQGVKDFMWTGTGVGSHQSVYPMYFAEYRDRQYTHAECGYLQVALETGLPGFVLLVLGIGLAGFWCWTALRRAPDGRSYVCATAITASLAVSVAHSVADFMWYIPGLMAITTVLLACAASLSRLHQGQEEPEVAPAHFGWAGRLAFACSILAVLPLGNWMAQNRYCSAMAASYWDEHMVDVHEKDPVELSAEEVAGFIDRMNSVLQWTPHSARAHLRLSALYLRSFELAQQESDNAMPLVQIREAAMQPGFKDKQAREAWLGRVLEKRRTLLDKASEHVRQALLSCPVHGKGYYQLVHLCFLHERLIDSKKRLLAQAFTVRPYEWKVLIGLGSECILASDFEQAIAYWRMAFNMGPLQREKLIELWASMQLPLSGIVQEMEPPLDAVRLLARRYEGLAMPEEFALLYARHVTVAEEAAKAEKGTAAADLWLEAQRAAMNLGDTERAIQNAQRAVAVEPGYYVARYALGACLYRAGKFTEAEQHFTWCQRRRPTDKRVQDALTATVKSRLGGASSTSTLRADQRTAIRR